MTLPKALFLPAIVACVTLPRIVRATPCNDGTSSCSESTPPSSPDRWRDRPFMIAGVAGVGTPVGMVGAVAEWAPIQYVAIQGGFGSSLSGLQYSAMLRIRGVADDASVGGYFGGGLSMGAFGGINVQAPSICGDCDKPPPASLKKWSHAEWANFEAGFEGRAKNGFAWRAFLGVASLLNPNDFVCSEATSCADDHSTATAYLYVGTSFGYAF